MQYFQTLDSWQDQGFTLVADITYETCHPADLFDVEDLAEILEGIDSGLYQWLMLRVRVLDGQGECLSQTTLGGLLYVDPRDLLKDGTVESLVDECLAEVENTLVSQ
jgi:hypothetical protein